MEATPSADSATAAAAKWRSDFSCAFQYYLDRSTPHAMGRWVGTRAVAAVYVLMVYLVQGFYIVSYGLGIYVLNLLIGFLSPMVDPGIEALDGPSLPTRGSDEFKPFIRRLPEFKFWKDMQRVIDSNEGFTRRVSKLFYFDDYSPIDIASILQSKIDTQDENSFVYGFKLHPDCTVNAMAQLIRENTIEELLKKMNGGLVDPLLVNALENMDLRLDVGCTDMDTLTTITMEDLEMALKFLSKLDG